MRTILRPFKVFSYLLAAESAGVVNEEGVLRIHLTTFSAKLKMSSFRVRKSLNWLNENGFFSEFSLRFGEAFVVPKLTKEVKRGLK